MRVLKFAFDSFPCSNAECPAGKRYDSRMDRLWERIFVESHEQVSDPVEGVVLGAEGSAIVGRQLVRNAH